MHTHEKDTSGISAGGNVAAGCMGGYADGQSGDCALTMLLSAAESVTLRHMREEERLARELYLTGRQLRGPTVFENIAQAEQRHSDSVA